MIPSAAVMRRYLRSFLGALCLVSLLVPHWVAIAAPLGYLPAYHLVNRTAAPGGPATPPVMTPLAVLLVEENLYNALGGKIDAYAQDLSAQAAVAPVVVPVPADASVFALYSGLRYLYLQGLEPTATPGVDDHHAGVLAPHFDLRLAHSYLDSVILIGQVPLPVVEKNGHVWQSPFPYGDFLAPLYEWNEEKGLFVNDEDARTEDADNVWEAVVSLIRFDDIADYRTYFDALARLYDRHADDPDRLRYFHDETWDKSYSVPYEESLMRSFLFDGPYQNPGMTRYDRAQYENFARNLENWAYGRYTDEWAEALFGDSNPMEEIPWDLLPPELVPDEIPSGDQDRLPDLLTKNSVQQFTKRYTEAYESFLSHSQQLMNEAGRWSTTQRQTTLQHVTAKDMASALYLKRFNDAVQTHAMQQLEGTRFGSMVSVMEEKHPWWRLRDFMTPQSLVFAGAEYGLIDLFPADQMWRTHYRSQLEAPYCSWSRGYPQVEGYAGEPAEEPMLSKDDERLYSLYYENPRMTTMTERCCRGQLNDNPKPGPIAAEQERLQRLGQSLARGAGGAVLAGEATISQLGTLTEADTAASVNETPPESDTSTDTCSPWDGHLPEPECSLIPRLHWDVRDADIPTYTEAGIAQYGRSLDTGTYACEPVLVAPRYPFSPTETLPSYTQYAQTQPYVPESPLRVWEVDEGRLLMDVHRFWSYMEHLMPTTEDIALQVDDFTAPKTPQDRPWGASWYFGSGNPYRFNLPNIFTHTELATPPVPSTTATVEAFKARVLQMLDDRQQALQETITAENAITQAELAATRTIEWPAIYRETLFEPWLKTAWEQYQDATHLGDLSYTPADVEMHCSYARTEEKLTRDEAYQYKRMDADAIAAYEALTQSAPDITAVTWIESCWLVDAANNYAKVSPTASESSLEYITQYYELHPLVPYYDANALAEDIDFRLLKEALEWIQTPIDEKNVFVLQSLSLAHQGEDNDGTYREPSEELHDWYDGSWNYRGYEVSDMRLTNNSLPVPTVDIVTENRHTRLTTRGPAYDAALEAEAGFLYSETLPPLESLVLEAPKEIPADETPDYQPTPITPPQLPPQNGDYTVEIIVRDGAPSELPTVQPPTPPQPPSTTSGDTTGSTTGSTDGSTDGNTTGTTDGNTSGSTDGTSTGSTTGSTDGTTSGSTDGQTTGTTTGSTSGSTTSGTTSGVTTGTTTPGGSDTDNDGIPDAEDDCPFTAPQEVVDEAGCTDTDLDGYSPDVLVTAPLFDPEDTNACVPNPQHPLCDEDNDGLVGIDDPCPTDSSNACDPSAPLPDSDGDGVPDEDDTCPLTSPKGVVDGTGCTDADDDGAFPDLPPLTPGADPDDANPCIPNLLSPLCDQDNDGTSNAEDPCPADPRNACDPTDPDGDGVPTEDDACPGTLPGASTTPEGCTDADGDETFPDGGTPLDTDDRDPCVPVAGPDCATILPPEPETPPSTPAPETPPPTETPSDDTPPRPTTPGTTPPDRDEGDWELLSDYTDAEATAAAETMMVLCEKRPSLLSLYRVRPDWSVILQLSSFTSLEQQLWRAVLLPLQHRLPAVVTEAEYTQLCSAIVEPDFCLERPLQPPTWDDAVLDFIFCNATYTPKQATQQLTLQASATTTQNATSSTVPGFAPLPLRSDPSAPSLQLDFIVRDSTGAITTALDGMTLQLLTDSPLLQFSQSAIIPMNGRATTTATSGAQAGRVTIILLHPDGTLLSQTTLGAVADDVAQLGMRRQSKYLLQRKEYLQTKILPLDSAGNAVYADGERSLYTAPETEITYIVISLDGKIELEGAGEEGITTLLASRDASAPLKLRARPDTEGVARLAILSPELELESEVSFIIDPDPYLVFDPPTLTVEAGQSTPRLVQFTAYHSDGALLKDYDFVAEVIAENPYVGQFVESEAYIRGGYGAMTVGPGIRAGLAEGVLVAEGIPPQYYHFTVTPSSPAKIEAKLAHHTVAQGQSVGVELQVFDRYRNPIQGMGGAVPLLPAYDDFDAMAHMVAPAGQNIQWQLSTAPSLGAHPITGMPTYGTLYMVAESIPGVVPATFTVEVVRTGPQQDIIPLSLMSVITGVQGLDVDGPADIAAHALATKKTPVVATLAEDPDARLQYGYVGRDGTVGPSLRMEFTPPQTTQLWYGQQLIAQTTTLFTEPSSFVPLSSYRSAPGAFSGGALAIRDSILTRQEAVLRKGVLWVRGVPVIAYKNDGVYIVNTRVTLTPSDARKITEWDLRYDGEFIGIVRAPAVRCGTVRSLELFTAQQLPGLTGESSVSPLCTLFIDPTRSAEPYNALGSDREGIEDVTRASSGNWNGAWQPLSQFAHGVSTTAGHAAQYGANDMLLLMGDPYIRLGTDSPREKEYIATDIGYPVWEGPTNAPIDQLFVANLDTPGEPLTDDLLIRIEDTVYALYNYGGPKHMGGQVPLISHVQEIYPVNVDNDAYTEVIVRYDSGELRCHDNVNGTYVPYDWQPIDPAVARGGVQAPALPPSDIRDPYPLPPAQLPLTTSPCGTALPPEPPTAPDTGPLLPPDALEIIENINVLDLLRGDSDGDGLPDQWDVLPESDQSAPGKQAWTSVSTDLQTQLETEQTVTSSGGMCAGQTKGLSLGFQMDTLSFLGPGKMNIYTPPITVAGPAMPGVPVFWFPLPGTPQTSTFRAYVMPTSSGNVGMAACLMNYGALEPLMIKPQCLYMGLQVQLPGLCPPSVDIPLADALSSNDFLSKSGAGDVHLGARQKQSDPLTDFMGESGRDLSAVNVPDVKATLPVVEGLSPSSSRQESQDELSNLNDHPLANTAEEPVQVPYPVFSPATLEEWDHQREDYLQALDSWEPQHRQELERFKRQWRDEIAIYKQKPYADPAFAAEYETRATTIENQTQDFLEKTAERRDELSQQDSRLQGYDAQKQQLLTVQQQLSTVPEKITEGLEALQGTLNDWGNAQRQRLTEHEEATGAFQQVVSQYADIFSMFDGMSEQFHTGNMERGQIIQLLTKMVLKNVQFPDISLPDFTDLSVSFSGVSASQNLPLPQMQLLPQQSSIPVIPQLSDFTLPDASLGMSAYESTLDTPEELQQPYTPAQLPATAPVPPFQPMTLLPEPKYLAITVPETFSFPIASLPEIGVAPDIPQVKQQLRTVLSTVKVLLKVINLLKKNVLPPQEAALTGANQLRFNRTQRLPRDQSSAPVVEKPHDTEVIEVDGQSLQGLEGLTEQTRQLQTDMRCNMAEIHAAENGDPLTDACENELPDFTVPTATAVPGYRLTFRTTGIAGLNGDPYTPRLPLHDAPEPPLDPTVVTALVRQTLQDLVLEGDPDANYVTENTRYAPETWTASTAIYTEAVGSESTVPIPTGIYWTENAVQRLSEQTPTGRYRYQFADIDGDGTKEILYSQGNRVYLEYRKPRSIPGASGPVVPLSWEDFHSLGPIAERIEPIEDGSTAGVQITRYDTLRTAIPYYEWNVSDRIDTRAQLEAPYSGRSFTDWYRHGFIEVLPMDYYTPRPLALQLDGLPEDTASLSSVRIFAPEHTAVPPYDHALYEDCNAADADNALYLAATDAVLVGEADTTRFTVRNPLPREAVTPTERIEIRSFTLHRGEEMQIPHGKLCVEDGLLSHYRPNAPIVAAPLKETLYFASGSWIEIDADGPTLLLSQTLRGLPIMLYPHTQYSLSRFQLEDHVLDFRREMVRKDLWGTVYALYQRGRDFTPSALSPVMLQTPVRQHTPPELLVAGGQQRLVDPTRPITIDLQASSDDGQITGVWYDIFDDGIIDYPLEADMAEITEVKQLLSYTLEEQFTSNFVVRVTVEDDDGMRSSLLLEFSVKPPVVQLLDASVRERRLRGKIDPQVAGKTVYIERDRDGVREIIAAIPTDQDGFWTLRGCADDAPECAGDSGNTPTTEAPMAAMTAADACTLTLTEDALTLSPFTQDSTDYSALLREETPLAVLDARPTPVWQAPGVQYEPTSEGWILREAGLPVASCSR